MGLKSSSAWFAISVVGVVAISTLTLPAERTGRKPRRLLVESVQPDYSKWELVKVGMTEEEVISLLGKPIEDSVKSPGLVFGRIKFDSPSMPDSFDFYILIHEGKVLENAHPFGGQLSRNGKPTTPVLIYPRDRSQFDHHPRFVDLRWYPSSGKYPMEYAIEVESGHYQSAGIDDPPVFVYHKVEEIISELPYVAFAFRGANPGRWRVKAKNELGESDWSEWRRFQFEQ
jgi:hypothetical protein